MATLLDLDLSAYSSYPRERDFNRGTHCVSSLFLWEIGKLHTNGLKKVIVEACTDRSDAIDRMIDVCMVRVKYDFDLHWMLKGTERKRLMLSKLYEGLQAIPSEYGVDQARISLTFERLAATNLRYEPFWGKAKASPDRKKYAQVQYKYDLDAVEIYVIFWRKGETKKTEILLTTTDPHEWRFVPLLGKLYWKDSETVCLAPRRPELSELCVRIPSP